MSDRHAPTSPAVPRLPRGPLYPYIPRQWTGPAHESVQPGSIPAHESVQPGPIPAQWSGPAQWSVPGEWSVPAQWSGPSGTVPAHWPGPPPAGLDAPLPVPRTHPVRNAAIGLAALLTMVVVLGGLVSSIGLTRPTAPGATTVRAWQDNGGLDRVKALLNDLEAAQDAGKAADVAGMGRACRSLHSDAEAAQAYTPIPDPEAQAHWAATLAHLSHASADCVTAISNRDANLFARATDEMAAVPADVSGVLRRLLALNR